MTLKMQWSLILIVLMGQCSFIDCHLYEYHYIIENKTWTEAQQYCRENHTDLATVTNLENMKRLVSVSAPYKREAWIGLSDQTNVIRIWYWSLPGVEFDEKETNWNEGEPSEKGILHRSENCGRVIQNLKWVDGSCKYDYPFLCYDETNRTHKYHLITQYKTWQKAQIYCREKHTDLVSGLKQLQDEELKKVMESSENVEVFIGLFRDTWRWSDGSSFSFRHWHEGFNNLGYNSDGCATSELNDDGRWKFGYCSSRKPFICYDDKVILIKENKTWEDALYYCRDHYHDLVTITNLDEQRWVQEKVKKASTDYVWMGLRYNCLMDMWFWVCKEMISYKNQERMNDCDMSGAMEAGGQQRWFQRNDTEKMNFICSKL